MKAVYRIGDFCFRLEADEEIVPPEHFELFRLENSGSGTKERLPEVSQTEIPQAEISQIEYEYRIMLVEKLPECSGSPVFQSEALAVYRSGDRENRLIFIAGEDMPYAWYEETDETHARIFYLSSRLAELKYDTIFVSLLALERRMLGKKGLILHCAYTIYQGKAILFSAPSGTGKSTQAELWRQYRGSRVVNGDRCLLQKKEGRWLAKGWPICGSSDICDLQEAPIGAVVFLAQGPENVVRPLSAGRAFSLLYGQITVNRWNRETGMEAMELLEDLLGETAAYHLSCTISQEAVECLAKAMGV